MKKLLFILGILLLTGCSQQFSGIRILEGRQGGTGIGTAVVGDVGDCISVSDDNPLTYTFGACAGGASGGYAEFTSVGDNQQNVSSTPFLFVNGLFASSTALFARATSFDSFSADKYELAGDFLTSFSSDATIAITGGALQCVDVTCTDCLNATEI